MLSQYRALFARPGTLSFVLAGLIGRFPLSMLGLGAVLLVTTRHGSYGVAGALSATLTVASAAGAPPTARLADRFGQHRVLPPSVLLFAVAIAGMVLAVTRNAPTWTYFPPAIVAGVAVPQIGSMIRTRWSAIVGGTPALNTALSLESALDEVVFVVGPVLATALAIGVWAPAGVVTAVGLCVIGGSALTGQRRTEPPPHPREDGVPHPAIRTRGVWLLVVVFIAVGGIFGTMDLAAVAFTQEHGHRGLAGIVLAGFALGSLLAGVGYGAVHWKAPIGVRFQRAVIGLALGTVPILLAPNIAVFTVAAFVAGFAISPSIVAGMSLIQALVPPRALTEGFAWVTTAIGIGVALGASIAGHVIDTVDAHHALIVAVVSGALATVVVLSGRSMLVVSRTVSPPDRRRTPASG